MSQDQNVGLIHLLDSAMLGSSHGETAVADFTVELLKHTGYVRRDRVARTRAGLPLLVCGEKRRAQVDVCVIDHGQGNEILLLVQEDRWSIDKHLVDANAQLVAKAISAFMMNNFNRQSADLPVLESKVIPGIVMAGTLPTFFKIPITQELEMHVRHGTYPPTPTVVTYCHPPLGRRNSDRMKPLENRRPILSCFEAFKSVVGI
ncbi:hypothetical protein NMY22_g11737 [Coprinellus aureogranulatus]|nr:hypothetical protein NMY22_g11737 [Coprinellus aureogranulatus]